MRKAKASGAGSSQRGRKTKLTKVPDRAHTTEVGTPDAEAPPSRNMQAALKVVAKMRASSLSLTCTGKRWAWTTGSKVGDSVVHPVTVARLVAAGLVRLEVRRTGLVDCYVSAVAL